MISSGSKRKRPREAPNVNTDLIEIYEDLANESDEIRLKAALRLLSTKYEDDQLDKILNRLFRGLCSGRKAARLGFSVALTEFLSHYAGSEGHFLPDKILETFEKQTNPVPGASGQELRDYYFGRLFAAEAIIKSKIFHNENAINAWPQFVNHILDVYEKKAWLREESGWVLYQALQGFEGKTELYGAAAMIFQQLETRKLLRSLESVALWTLCRTGNYGSLKLPSNVFRNDNPLDGKERESLIAAMKGTTIVTNDTDSAATSNASSTWSNKIHFGWFVIFEASKTVDPDGAARPNQSPQGRGTLFRRLWSSFVDEYLFASSASEQRKYWGFLMVQRYIEYLQNFEKPFLRCFSNQLSKSDRHLHGIASKTMKVIQNAIDADASHVLAGRLLVDMIMLDQVDFDKTTKTKFVEKLWIKADSMSRMTAIADIKLAICTVPDGIDRTEAQWQIACADLLLACVKNYQGPTDAIRDRRQPAASVTTHVSDEDIDVMREIVKVLTHFGHSTVLSDKTTSRLEMSQQTREIFRTRLLSALSHLITQGQDVAEFPFLAATELLGVDRKYRTQPMADAPEAIFKIIERAGRSMKRCRKRELNAMKQDPTSSDIKVARTFRLLFALSIVQAFSGDGDTINVLQELVVAAKSIVEVFESTDNSDSFIGVVEIILSLLAKPSVLFRRVGKEVFSSCASMIEVDALDPLFNVLEKKENLNGQQELFDANDEDDDVEEASNLDVSDVEEVVNGNDSDDNASSGNGDEDDDDEEVIEFENKLAQALGTQRVNSGSAVVQENEDTDEDMMDDDQMAALDPIMSNMFKQHKQASRKKDHQNAKETIVTFKIKVLELLEIYVRQMTHGSNIRSSTVVLLRCLECMRDTNSKQVSEKCGSVVKTALNVYKLSIETGSDKTNLRQAKKALSAIHELLQIQGSNAYIRACSQASLFCAKVMLNNGGAIEQIWKVYSKTGEVMATSQDCKIISLLFQDWFNWLGTAKMTLSKRVEDSAVDIPEER